MVSLSILAPSYHMLEARTRSNVSHNPDDHGDVVVFASTFVGLHVRAGLFLARVRIPVHRFVVVVGHGSWIEGRKMDGTCALQPAL